MEQRGFNLPIPPFHDGITRVGRLSGIVLYREGPFQVQLWLCDPNSEIPDHAHPNVDALQVYVGGQLYLRHNGQPLIPQDHVFEADDGTCSQRGAALRIRPGETHGASIGEIGASFVTFQHWLNGLSPRSVESDWDGELLSDDHVPKTTSSKAAK